jgi:hypothetical protein
MRILYLSCHSILEYDEVLLLSQLGHYVFSPGAYVEPDNPGYMSLRPGLNDVKYDDEDIKQWHALGKEGKDNKECLTKEFVDRFDCIIIMHLPKWIKVNWEVMKHKPVIWRTIGQSISGNEAELKPYRDQGLNIIRYSPKERTTPGYIGEDVLIRFYKDPEEYKGWTGEENKVVAFGQHMKRRDFACNFSAFEKATKPFPRKLYGPESEEFEWGTGKVPYEELKEAMRTHRCLWYAGTHPASYTLTWIEATMTGIPPICVGPKLGNATYFPGHDLYEIPQIVKNGVNGFVTDNITEMQGYIKTLLDNPTLAAKISKNTRETAIKLFGKDKIMKEWKEYLETFE